MRLDQEGVGSLPAVLAIASHRNGRQFFMGLLCAAAAAAPAGKICLHGHCGESFSEVMGEVRSVLPECTLIMPDNRGIFLWEI